MRDYPCSGTRVSPTTPPEILKTPTRRRPERNTEKQGNTPMSQKPMKILPGGIQLPENQNPQNPETGTAMLFYKANEIHYKLPSGDQVTLAQKGQQPPAHQHSTADITSGTLPVERGGTGTSSFTGSKLLQTNAQGNAIQELQSSQSGGVFVTQTSAPEIIPRTQPDVYPVTKVVTASNPPFETLKSTMSGNNTITTTLRGHNIQLEIHQASGSPISVDLTQALVPGKRWYESRTIVEKQYMPDRTLSLSPTFVLPDGQFGVIGKNPMLFHHGHGFLSTTTGYDWTFQYIDPTILTLDDYPIGLYYWVTQDNSNTLVFQGIHPSAHIYQYHSHSYTPVENISPPFSFPSTYFEIGSVLSSPSTFTNSPSSLCIVLARISPETTIRAYVGYSFIDIFSGGYSVMHQISGLSIETDVYLCRSILLEYFGITAFYAPLVQESGNSFTIKILRFPYAHPQDFSYTILNTPPLSWQYSACVIGEYYVGNSVFLWLGISGEGIPSNQVLYYSTDSGANWTPCQIAFQPPQGVTSVFYSAVPYLYKIDNTLFTILNITLILDTYPFSFTTNILFHSSNGIYFSPFEQLNFPSNTQYDALALFRYNNKFIRILYPFHEEKTIMVHTSA